MKFSQMKSAALGALVLVLSATGAATAQDQDVVSMDKLLQEVRQGRRRDAQELKQREAAFLKDAQAQDALIAQAQARIAELEGKSVQLEQRFNANELKVEEKRAQRDERLGSLKELFGHLTGAAGDLRARFASAISSAQFPDRQDFLSGLIRKMSDDTELPTVEDIEQLWFELHRELTASAQVVKFNTAVGTEGDREVVRIGLFNLVSNGEYLSYEGEAGVSALPRQPQGQAGGLQALQSASAGRVPVGIDPTGASGGGYLRALINNPTLIERWHQGKLVGYVISVVGVLGLLLAAWRFAALARIGAAVRRQRNSQEARDDNPLGRVLLAGEAHAGDDIETLEVKLGEAIIKERPAIQRGLPLIKIIAMVAPLMGLLGTVTGMIIVFQAITIYGAGDPKAMAGGISSALITTVLGLIVAIPMLLAHTLLHGRARELLHVLEEQTAGIVSQRVGR